MSGQHRFIVPALAFAVGLPLYCAPALADPALIDLLRSKAILSDADVRALRAAAAPREALVRLLRDKGVLTAAEAAGLAGTATAPRATPRHEATTVRADDGITIEDPAAGTRFTVGGRLHADYRAFPGSGFATGAVDTFDVRRARLAVGARFAQHYDAEITGDFGTTARIDTAYLNAAWSRHAQLRLGLFKMPFSLEEMTSSNYTDFQERSLANAQAPGKERGIMVHGAPVRGLTYALAFSNGNGGAGTDENDHKDLIGRITFDAATIAGVTGSVLHLGASTGSGKRQAGDVAPSSRTEARGVTFFDPSPFTAQAVDVRRLGIESALAFGPVKVQAERITTRHSGASATGVAYQRDLAAHYASVTWLATGERYVDSYRNGVFGRIRPGAGIGTAGGIGAIELGLRYSRMHGGDFDNTGSAGTGTLGAGLAPGASAWTYGLKWITHPNVRFMLNVVDTRFAAPVTIGGVRADRERAITVRGQLSF